MYSAYISGLTVVVSSVQQIADVTLFMSTIFHVTFSVGLIFANGRRMKEIREYLAKDIHVLVVSVRQPFLLMQPFLILCLSARRNNTERRWRTA